jgi:GT2 family glycosyltransferase
MRSQSKLPTVAIVIPTAGRRPASLARLIESVLEDPATSEVIVVLDHDAPSTKNAVAHHAREDPRVRLIPTNEPAHPARDFGQASRDVGLRHARAEVILSLDDDLEPAPNLVTGHAKRHAEEAGLVVQGYTPVVPPRSRRGDSRAAVRLYARNYELTCDRFRDGSEDVLIGLWGGHFSVRRQDWIRAEELADDLEDAPARAAARHIDRALGFRLRAAGLISVFDSKLVAAHPYHRSLGEVPGYAHSIAYGRTCLHLAYPEVVPPPQRNSTVWAERLQVPWISRSTLLSWLATQLVLAISHSAAALRLTELEFAGARALFQLGYACGIRDACADLSPPRMMHPPFTFRTLLCKLCREPVP